MVKYFLRGYKVNCKKEVPLRDRKVEQGLPKQKPKKNRLYKDDKSGCVFACFATNTKDSN